MAELVQQGTIIHLRDLSPSVRELTLAAQQPIRYAPGQWVSLKLPVGPRPPLVRAYSMAEPESPSGQLVIVFDRVPDGLGSGYLFTLKPGDTVALSGPHGNFLLPQPLTKDLLFVARFTGIVPIRCIIQHLAGSGRLPPMTLIYSAPSRAELIYDDEFRQLVSAHQTFRYHPVLQDTLDHPDEQDIHDIVRSVVQTHRGVFPMVAGTKAFVRPLRAWLSEIGFERRAMRHESYD
jgi:NAD(P)H-flavin reductase